MIRTLAPAAGYVGFESYAESAVTQLAAGQPVGSLLLIITALLSFLQGQDAAPPSSPPAMR